MRTIGRLAQARSGLLAELTGLEERERRALSEHLHDGALQYVLAARFDLDDARETGDPAAFDRLEQALAESTRLLRSTVAELHPAVLARAGLPSALRDLATRGRGAGRPRRHRRRRGLARGRTHGGRSTALPHGGRAAEQRGEARRRPLPRS